ncbi:MAG: carbohydrate kinase family protein [Lachnospiraceae bacterium]|nr:carbohydrate kinase family protein [Lachnospiraceae bacterium]
MGKFIIAGITQLETIVKVDKIPITYQLFTGGYDTIFTSVGGDAYNGSLALKWLGDDVKFMTVVGRDQSLGILNPPDRNVTLDTKYVLPIMHETPMEVLFFDQDRHQQLFEDLKDIRNVGYDMSLVEPAIKDCDMLVLSNANFCRPFIEMAAENNVKIALNIHAFRRDKEKYNVDFLENADIVFIRDDALDEDPYEFVQEMADKYNIETILLGQGLNGVLHHDNKKKSTAQYKPIRTGKVLSTAGAGNALFACYLHYYLKGGDSANAVHKALLFMSNKIGYMGSSNGFMTEEELERWEHLIWDFQGTNQNVASMFSSTGETE